MNSRPIHSYGLIDMLREVRVGRIEDYENTIDWLIQGLCLDNHQLAMVIASIPERIRGFGRGKSHNLTEANAEWLVISGQIDIDPNGRLLGGAPARLRPNAPGRSTIQMHAI